MIGITHTHAGGTMVDGTARGDGTAEILKPRRFRWSRNIGAGAWYLPHSRDKNAQTRVIDGLAEALRAAGHEVTVTVDDSERRTFAEAEAERAERAAERAERMAGYAANAAARSDAAYQRSRQMAEAIPFGQPMMPDHYSYRRDVNYRGRMHSLMDKSVAEADKAEHYANRAANAETYQASRENIPRTLRRIEKLEADARRTARDIAGREEWRGSEADGYRLELVRPGPAYMARLERRAADLADQIAYWRGIVAQAEDTGVKVWGPADFAKGDYCQRRGYPQWYQIERVNPKSLSVPHGLNERDLAVVTRDVVTHAMGPSQWVWKVTYDEVSGKRTAAEMAEQLASA